ncbi:unconventional myosin-XVI [Amblyraja radiata]|uniref:unconventional myosin-XVI n=1 Tax=Amblyraja radiata TaxID=386614 RepID=UPI001403EAE4|nr:unconventional myosin-XVI [Amblyraja radiata]
MEIDQCLLESLPSGRRQQLVKRMRCEQVKAYYEREKLQQQTGFKHKQAKKRNVHFRSTDMIKEAIVRHDDKEVLKLLKDGADPNTLISSGGSLLHLCARHDNIFAAEILIEKGVNVNHQDEDLWTSLHVACACDNPDFVLLLMPAGINVLLQDVNGNIALDYAMDGTETSFILLGHLEDNGVDVNSLLQIKMQRPSKMLEDVRNLVACKGNVDQKNDEGVTLLHMACASGYMDVSTVLLGNRADPDVYDNCFWTPLHLAAKYGQIAIVKLLLIHHANPNLLNCNAERPSDVATAEYLEEMLLKAEEDWKEMGRQCTACLNTEINEEANQEHNYSTPIPMKQITPLALPIAKQDSMLEKDTLFKAASRSLCKQNSQERHCANVTMNGTCGVEQVKLVPPAPNDDLSTLSELTDRSLLYEIQKRFSNNQIYTHIGHILLLVNPYKDLPIYSTIVTQIYRSSTGKLCSSLPPHIFSCTERALHVMWQEQKSQCFILSGESGSGKTEVCKHIVKHLARRAAATECMFETKFNHVNCVLESFGHAKTTLNLSSSRYMKWLEVQFNENNRTLSGARVHAYCLEKSRLVSRPPNQCNFNIFYQMTDGLSTEGKCASYLSNPFAHRYMNQDGQEPTASEVAINTDKFFAVKQALRTLGFSNLEIDSLFLILSAILLLGDIQFLTLTDTETACVSDVQLLEQVAGILQVSPDEFNSALTSDIHYSKGDVIFRRHTVDVANFYRDLLAKTLYGRLFHFLVDHINYYLQNHNNMASKSTLNVGILDTFGFEDFQKNGYEQLCINITNEKIHQYVHETLFQQQQMENIQEGTTLEQANFLDNQNAILDFFFQKPGGLLSILDEEGETLRSTEQSLRKCLQIYLESAQPNTVYKSTKGGNETNPSKDQALAFTVMHYAGRVTYNLTGAAEKNKTSLSQNLLIVMKASENVLIHQIFQRKRSQTASLIPSQDRMSFRGPKTVLLSQNVCFTSRTKGLKKFLEINSKFLKKKRATTFFPCLDHDGSITLAAQLRSSICDIMGELKNSTPHLVYCIKPNTSAQADVFDDFYVSAQLQYIGVLEIVKLIRHGYPVRLSFSNFLARYKTLAEISAGVRKELSAEDKCHLILQQCKLQGWQINQGDVLMKYWQADHLNDQCLLLQKKIVICQKVVREFLARQKLVQRMSIKREVNSIERFLQLVEDMGLKAYDSLVIQNATDIARENDRIRNELNTVYMREKLEARHSDEPATIRLLGCRALKHFLSSSVPIPTLADGLAHSVIGSSIRSPSLHSVFTMDDSSGLQSPRKQPPPKPKRDPNTRLSASYEAVTACISPASKEAPNEVLTKPRPHSDDYSTMKKIPPPKPKRSPNTRLTGSYEEIYVRKPPSLKFTCSMSKAVPSTGIIQRAASADGPQYGTLSLHLLHNEDVEPVYIEMGGAAGNYLVEMESPDQGESVYEEMKYCLLEDSPCSSYFFDHEACPPPGFERKTPTLPDDVRASSPPVVGCKMLGCDIPPPFPNLLPHRPPLLVFPPTPVQCSPASDESPLTPLEVKRIPVLETNLTYPMPADEISPTSPQFPSHQMGEDGPPASPDLGVFSVSGKMSSPPITPSLPLIPTPPYKPTSHFIFPPDIPTSCFGSSGKLSSNADVPKLSQKPNPLPGRASPTNSMRLPSSPVKSCWTETGKNLSSSTGNVSLLSHSSTVSRPITSPLDELSNLFSSGRSLLRKSATGRKIREQSGVCGERNCSPSNREETCGPRDISEMQDNNANNPVTRLSPAMTAAPSVENENQLLNGNLYFTYQ